MPEMFSKHNVPGHFASFYAYLAESKVKKNKSVRISVCMQQVRHKNLQ